MPQQVHVIDRVRAGDHPCDQRPDLQLRVRAGLARHPQRLRDEVVQPGPPGQGDHRGQARTGHKIRVVKDHRDPRGVMGECRVAATHCCVAAPSEPYVPLIAAYGSSKPHRATWMSWLLFLHQVLPIAGGVRKADLVRCSWDRAGRQIVSDDL